MVSYDETLAQVPATAKLDAVLAIEKAALESVDTVKQCEGTQLSTMSGEVYLRNSYGLNLQHKDNALLPTPARLRRTATARPRAWRSSADAISPSWM